MQKVSLNEETFPFAADVRPVARVVHFLRLHLVGKTIKFAKAIEDTSVFGKVGTSGSEVEKALTGRKVVSAGTQGKYFWFVVSTI